MHRARLTLLAGGLLLCALVGTARAQSIPVTAHITADGHYALYVGSADGAVMRFIGRNEYGLHDSAGPPTPAYKNPETWTFQVHPDDYIFIVAWDDNGSGAAMLIADFIAPDALLVTNRASWQTTRIPTGWPGTYGDPNLADVRAVMDRPTGWADDTQWCSPKAEYPNDNPYGYAIQGIDPSAMFIWPDYAFSFPYAIFRAPASKLLPQQTCADQLADANATIAQLTAQVGSLQASFTQCSTNSRRRLEA